MKINNQISNGINSQSCSKVNFSSKIRVRIFSNIQFPNESANMLREETIAKNIETIVHSFLKILQGEIEIENGNTIINCFKNKVWDNGLDKKKPIITLSVNKGDAFLYTGQDALNLRTAGANIGRTRKCNPQISDMHKHEYAKIAKNSKELQPGLTIYTSGSLSGESLDQIYKFKITDLDFLPHTNSRYGKKPNMIVRVVADESMNPTPSLKTPVKIKPQLATTCSPRFFSTSKSVLKGQRVEQCSLVFN